MATKISDPIKNQIEADLELSEEYTTSGGFRPSLASSERQVVFVQVKLFTPGQDCSPDWSPCTAKVDLRERNIQISSLIIMYVQRWCTQYLLLSEGEKMCNSR